MKNNIRELAELSDKPCIIEGRLNYRKLSNGSYRNPTVFKERWFRLINNFLFYFKISETGKFDTKNPAGVFVMENTSIQMEHGQSISFSFSISFMDEPDKKHVFAARSEDNVVQWVITLRECSYEYLRNRLYTLQSKIFSMTGKDPLLLVPRNEGSCLWAPAIPFSTTPACTVNTTSFSCHLHTQGYTLERSKSDIQTHAHLKKKYGKSTTFYMDSVESGVKDVNTDETANQRFVLGRSKTSALVPPSISNEHNTSIFDNRPTYSRAAPSPPVRTKLSPRPKRNEVYQEVQMLNEHSSQLGLISILDEAPVPPRRKVSPKPEVRVEHSSEPHDSNEDLIQF